MNLIDDRLTTVEKILKDEQEALRRGANRALVGFIAIAIVVLLYTSYVIGVIHSHIGPEGLKVHGESVVNMIAAQPDGLVRLYGENKDAWATLVVDRAYQAIPEVEAFLTNQMDIYTDAKGTELKRDLFPALTAYLRQTAPELKAGYAAEKKQHPELTFGEYLSDVYVQFLDSELRKHVVDFDAAETLANDVSRNLYHLQKPGRPLTKRDVAERKIVINLVLLAKLGIDDSPIYEEFVKFMEQRFGITPDLVDETAILPDIESNEPVNEGF